MSFNASFTLTGITATNGFTLTDNSTGSDTGLTDRTISLLNSSGGLFNGSTIDWPIGQTSITLNVLPTDAAINVSVSWTSSSPLPSPSTYSFSQLQAFTQYGETFAYQLTQEATAQPTIINDNNFYYNKMRLRVELDSAVQAITEGSDIYSAQGCINRYQQLINNSTLYF